MYLYLYINPLLSILNTFLMNEAGQESRVLFTRKYCAKRHTAGKVHKLYQLGALALDNYEWAPIAQFQLFFFRSLELSEGFLLKKGTDVYQRKMQIWRPKKWFFFF